MTRQTRRLPLMSSAPGGSRHLLLHSYGLPEARPKAYIQAALHADEIPGLLVQHHLLRRLDAVRRRQSCMIRFPHGAEL